MKERLGAVRVQRLDQIYRFMPPGELLDGTEDPAFKDAWRMARADSFQPAAGT